MMEEEKIDLKQEGKTQEEFMNDPENIQGSLSLSSAFEDFMGSKWFTIDKLCRKTGMDRLQAIQKVQMCKLFGHVAMRIGTARDGAEKVRQPLFKITIALKDKISALDGIIQYHRDMISDMELQKKIYLAKLEDQNQGH